MSDAALCVVLCGSSGNKRNVHKALGPHPGRHVEAVVTGTKHNTESTMTGCHAATAMQGVQMMDAMHVGQSWQQQFLRHFLSYTYQSIILDVA